jgi:hypothetical protein
MQLQVPVHVHISVTRAGRGVSAFSLNTRTLLHASKSRTRSVTHTRAKRTRAHHVMCTPPARNRNACWPTVNVSPSCRVTGAPTGSPCRHTGLTVDTLHSTTRPCSMFSIACLRDTEVELTRMSALGSLWWRRGGKEGPGEVATRHLSRVLRVCVAEKSCTVHSG